MTKYRTESYVADERRTKLHFENRPSSQNYHKWMMASAALQQALEWNRKVDLMNEAPRSDNRGAHSTTRHEGMDGPHN